MLKMIINRLLLTLCLMMPLAQACELARPVHFAALSWDSNALHTAIARFIMQHGYGCSSATVAGDVLPSLTQMAEGTIDVTMEIWRENIEPQWEAALASGRVVDLGTNFPDAEQGWYIPHYVQQAQGEVAALAADLTHVNQLIDYKALFQDQNSEEIIGRFYNCVKGWSCEAINSKKLQAYGLDAHYVNFHPVTSVAFEAAISVNYDRQKPFLAYHWSPSWILGHYHLIKLKEPTYRRTAWQVFLSSDEPSDAVAYPLTAVKIGANAQFVQQAPQLVQFLQAYQTTAELTSTLLAYMKTQAKTPTTTAHYFLRTYPKVWQAWVPPEVFNKVQAAL